MTRSRLALCAAAGAAVLACPAVAAAAPPPNDNYLASTSIVSRTGTLPSKYTDRVDTSEATTQADTFDPNREGQPLGGGDPEPTSCGGGAPSFGRTAWWDFKPPFPGRVQIRAGGGFDVVVAVYEWSRQTSRITRVVRCQNDGAGAEDVLLPKVRKGADYTIQVGGLNNTGGPLELELSYSADRDADGILDALDACKTRAGIRASRGCPPKLRAAPRIRYDRVAGGIRVTRLAVDGMPRGARAEVRCRRCGSKVSRRARRAGSLSLSRFAGRVVRAGDRIEVRVSLGPTGKGRYRFGAIGRYFRWPVTAGGLGRRVSKCTNPGSRRPIKCP
jgi:hypothetical protein